MEGEKERDEEEESREKRETHGVSSKGKFQSIAKRWIRLQIEFAPACFSPLYFLTAPQRASSTALFTLAFAWVS